MMRTLLDDTKSGKLGPFLLLIFFFQKIVASLKIRAPWKVVGWSAARNFSACISAIDSTSSQNQMFKNSY